MIRWYRLFGLAALAAALLPGLAAPAIGARVDNFSLSDCSGKTHSLRDYSGKIVVLVFWSFKCPVMLTYDRKIQELQDRYRDKGVVVFGVDANSDETADAIRKNASNLDVSYPILLDVDGVVAQKLGASQTPSLFILDRSSVIRYVGVIDNGRKRGERGYEAYAEQALDAMTAGKDVAVPETRGAGCSIKRRY